MPYVQVPKDLSKVKTKLAFNLTKRQLICFSGAAAVGIPAYLLTRSEVGRKDALGRPILYGTTDAFLRHFCLNSLADLPEIDFSALADRIAEAEAKQAAEKPHADPVEKLAQNIAQEEKAER